MIKFILIGGFFINITNIVSMEDNDYGCIVRLKSSINIDSEKSSLGTRRIWRLQDKRSCQQIADKVNENDN